MKAMCVCNVAMYPLLCKNVMQCRHPASSKIACSLKAMCVCNVAMYPLHCKTLMQCRHAQFTNSKLYEMSPWQPFVTMSVCNVATHPLLYGNVMQCRHPASPKIAKTGPGFIWAKPIKNHMKIITFPYGKFHQTLHSHPLHIKRWRRRWRHCIQYLVDHNWTWRHFIEKRIAGTVFLRLQSDCNGLLITVGDIAYISASKHTC